MNVPEYLKASGSNLHRLSQQTGIAYSTLAKHVNHGHELSVATAKKLEAFDSRMTAAEILGLSAPPAPPAVTGTEG